MIHQVKLELLLYFIFNILWFNKLRVRGDVVEEVLLLSPKSSVKYL